MLLYVYSFMLTGNFHRMNTTTRLWKLSLNLSAETAQTVVQNTANILTSGTATVFGLVFRAINVVASCESTFVIQQGKNEIRSGKMLLSGRVGQPKRLVGTILSYKTLYKNSEEATEVLVLARNELITLLLWETDRNIKWHVLCQ